MVMTVNKIAIMACQHCTRSTQEHINEIQDYWKGRYLSTGEAMWRIMGFNITKKEPSVTAMSVQLPTDQRVQRYIRNDNANILSPLDHYFLCPIGTYLQDSITLRSQDLKFEQYFSIFRLAKFDSQKAHLPNYFLEQENRYGPPQMHVILRTGRFCHYARICEVSLSGGELFYMCAVLQIHSLMHRQLTELSIKHSKMQRLQLVCSKIGQKQNIY
jgi:hypothetical protein